LHAIFLSCGTAVRRHEWETGTGRSDLSRKSSISWPSSSWGNRLAIKGNINTFDFKLNAKPQEVADKCKALIDAAGADGGFVLSTGDQCGRDTPLANLFAMVEVAKTYGGY
jgi:uroporphyrinogen-III decarboxylase